MTDKIDSIAAQIGVISTDIAVVTNEMRHIADLVNTIKNSQEKRLQILEEEQVKTRTTLNLYKWFLGAIIALISGVATTFVRHVNFLRQ